MKRRSWRVPWRVIWFQFKNGTKAAITWAQWSEFEQQTTYVAWDRSLGAWVKYER